MYFKDIFTIGEIFQSKSKTKADLDLDNCQITEKRMNNKSIILHIKRATDGKEANVFVRLKDEFKDSNKLDFKKLFASNKIIGLSLNQLNNTKVEEL